MTNERTERINRSLPEEVERMKAKYPEYHLTSLDLNALTDNEWMILEDAKNYMQESDFRRTLDGVAIRQRG